MKWFLENKKGITPVLSSVLLTVLAVAAMSLVASATYLVTNNMRQIMGERVIVEEVWFTPNGVSIYLRNIGKVDISIASVYVNYTTQSFTPMELEVDGHGWTNITFDWKSGGLYNIHLITIRGTKIVDYYNAP